MDEPIAGSESLIPVLQMMADAHPSQREIYEKWIKAFSMPQFMIDIRSQILDQMIKSEDNGRADSL